MFGSIGFPELVLIFVVALLLFGPRKLPEIGRSVGKAMGEFRRASNDLQRTLEEEVALDDVRKVRDEVAASVAGVASAVKLDMPPAGEAAVFGAPAEGKLVAPPQPGNPVPPDGEDPVAVGPDALSVGDPTQQVSEPDAASLPDSPALAEPK